MECRTAHARPRRRAGAAGAVVFLHLAFAAHAAAQSRGVCVGDVDGDGAVTVDEIITGVNIALGTRPLNDGPAFDSNGDDEVTIEELITAVNAALLGCSASPCGNARLEAPEGCDDGNRRDGDGCDARCQAERGYECSGVPSICILDFGFMYAVNELDARVSVVNTATAVAPAVGRAAAGEMGDIAVIGVPRDIALSGDGRVAYISTRAPDAVAVVDTASRALITTIANVGVDPEAIASSPRTDAVYVTNVGDDTVSVIDTATNAVRQTIGVGESPNDIAVMPDGTCAYVSNSAQRGTVSAIDTGTNTVIATVPVEEFPSAIAVTPDGQHTWVANFISGTISVINTASNRVVSTVFVRDLLPTESLPTGIAFSPNGQLAYVTSFVSHTVLILDTAKAVTQPAQAFIRAIPVAAFPTSVQFDPRGRVAFVTNFARDPQGFPVDGFLAVIDTTASQVINRIPVGTFALRLAVAPPPNVPTRSPTATATAGLPTRTPTPLPNCGAVSCPIGSRCNVDVNCHQLGGDCANRDTCLPS